MATVAVKRFPPVLVMNPHYTGLGIARSFSGSGVAVYGLTADPGAPGRSSRFFRRIYRVPDSRDEPQALYQRLLTLKTEFPDRPVIFPTRDFDVLFLHRYREELSSIFRIPQGAGSAVPSLLDKLETARLAERAGVDSPRTVLCCSRKDLEKETGRLRFPVVLKPRSAHEWRQGGVWQKVGARKAILAETAKRLVAEFEGVIGITGAVLVQEFVPGGDDALVTFGCCMGAKGELLGYFTGRKLRQDPPQFGTGCSVELIDIPEIVAPSVHLLETVGYQGPAEIEYKLDRRDGRFWLIEVNPRLWDQHELGCRAGVNISLIAYSDAVGASMAPQVPNYRMAKNARWIAERELTLLILRSAWLKLVETWRRRPARWSTRLRDSWRVVRVAMAEGVALLQGARMFSVSAVRDPLPGVLLWTQVVAEVLRGVVRRPLKRIDASPGSEP
jgi:predicted ATP-grasp superfamily ATP-dependent carboligase